MSIIDDLVPELVGLGEEEIRERIEVYLDKQARDMAAVVLGLALSDIDLTPEQRSLIVVGLGGRQGAFHSFPRGAGADSSLPGQDVRNEDLQTVTRSPVEPGGIPEPRVGSDLDSGGWVGSDFEFVLRR